jgi:hypothetical protein
MQHRRALPWIALLLLAAVIGWWITHRGRAEDPAPPPAASSASAASAALDQSDDGDADERYTEDGAPVAKARSGAAGVGAALSSPQAGAPGATSASGSAPPPTASPAPSSTPPGSAPIEGEPGTTSGLRDRTGWGKALLQQLDRELMPMAAECIEMAKARNPRLEGMLALDLSLVPTEPGKAIVESVKEASYNQVRDPELVECLRQSSFALEGLDAPYNFTLSMPVDR